MKKFGFGKKGDVADDDANRSALFGSRTKSKDKVAPSSNPYAQPTNGPQKSDPYAKQDPYGSAAPPPYNGSNDSFRKDKSPVPAGGYGGGYGGGYSGQAGGNQGGYGASRYGGGATEQAPSSRYGLGGYGGLGRADSQDTDAGRDALFGGAAQRYQQQQQQPQASQPGGAYNGAPGGAGGYGTEASQGYGAYGDRELTQEEQEEEDISATKQEIKFIKQQDVSSTRNALRLAQQAEETGRDTLARLGAQGERIHNTERNLDLASSQNRIAEEKARELKTLNKSMFAMHVGNPFTSEARREARDAAIMDTHRKEREQRDTTRQAAYESQARAQQAGRDLNGNPTRQPMNKATLAERAKYQFEADSEDDEMENEIDANLDALHGAAKRLNGLGRAMGQEVDEQNKHIDRITGKTDKVDDQIAMNRARLDRIR
ncbi:uncharacterized protein K441DRAFT_588453 [Cenococcum geophilum 1.58]|uniref:uncharacterized protein n=1 Tax=Cenococcum geophilum 1.58 TaxID=794803 RepID=UPI000DC91B68|nr:hypothetical protein K441DRAFT_588453 [Cenococcum geophilum 1.58]